MTHWYWKFLPEFKEEGMFVSRKIEAPAADWVTVTTTEFVDATIFGGEPTLFGMPSASALARRAPMTVADNHRCPWCGTPQDNTIIKCPNCGGPQ